MKRNLNSQNRKTRNQNAEGDERMNRCKYCHNFYEGKVKNSVKILKKGLVFTQSDYCSDICLDKSRLCDAKRIVENIKEMKE